MQLCFSILKLFIACLAGLTCSETPLNNGTLSTNNNSKNTALVYPFLQANRYSPENNLKADSIIIPLKRAGRLFLIEANVDNEIGNLVFDTGANGVVFNSTYFRNHNKTKTNSSNGITGDAGTMEMVTIDHIEFAGLTYKKVSADMTNLGPIENRRGVKILGLIGFNMFRDFEILIDSKNNQLKLYKIDKSGNRINSVKSTFYPDQTQKLRTSSASNIVFLEGNINGKNLTFCLDTGAETNVINSYSGKAVLNTLTITRRAGLRGVGGAGSDVLYGVMNDFLIGKRQIKGMETIVSNLGALSEAYGTKIDGMLGFNFMEQGILCINFQKSQFGIQFTKGELE